MIPKEYKQLIGAFGESFIKAVYPGIDVSKLPFREVRDTLITSTVPDQTSIQSNLFTENQPISFKNSDNGHPHGSNSRRIFPRPNR